jgi:hypothetical protein
MFAKLIVVFHTLKLQKLFRQSPERLIFETKIRSTYVEELRRWQKELNRVTELDEDPFSDPVELQDVVDAAKRLNKVGDKNWS